jgi:hypothetical protein
MEMQQSLSSIKSSPAGAPQPPSPLLQPPCRRPPARPPQAWEARHNPGRDWYLQHENSWPELSPGIAGFLVQVGLSRQACRVTARGPCT